MQTLILFPKPDGSYVPYFLNIYPDSPDKKFKLQDFIEGGYQKIPQYFSGVYRFYRWNGDFISGWRIKDGVKTHRIKESKSSYQSNKSARTSSFTLYCYELVTTWYQYSCSETFGCTQPIAIGETVSGTECDLVVAPPSPSNPGESGGGGGGTPPNTGENCEEPEGNLEGVTVDCDEEVDAEEVIYYIENDLYQQLTTCEKELIRSSPSYSGAAILVYLNKNIAQNKTVEIFGYDGWNDCSDAFRHAYWNALMTKSVGLSSATLFGTAHECVSGSPNLENQMDLHNNNIGRELAFANSGLNNDELASLVFQMLQAGELRVISNLAPQGNFTLSSQLINSSQC